MDDLAEDQVVSWAHSLQTGYESPCLPWKTTDMRVSRLSAMRIIIKQNYLSAGGSCRSVIEHNTNLLAHPNT